MRSIEIPTKQSHFRSVNKKTLMRLFRRFAARNDGKLLLRCLFKIWRVTNPPHGILH
jgi:hypothetical protein